MTSTRKWATIGMALVLASVLGQSARATLISFTVDPTGNGTGSTPIANTAGNVGKYAAGSWLTLSGSIVATTSGLSASSTFAAQTGQGATGAWSTGNPGSLTAFYTGNLLVDYNKATNMISFPGGSSIDASTYNKQYALASPQNPAVVLGPAVGGGTTTTPGSAPANYGVSLNLKALGIISVASGNAALRGTVTDINTPGNITLGAGGSFVTTSANVGIASGNLDYNLSGTANLAGTTSISGAFAPNNGAAAGTLVATLINPSRQIYDFSIVVPVKSSIVETITGTTPVTATITVTGQVAAFANNVQIPEPATFVLAGFAAVPLGFLAWRRRKRA